MSPEHSHGQDSAKFSPAFNWQRYSHVKNTVHQGNTVVMLKYLDPSDQWRCHRNTTSWWRWPKSLVGCGQTRRISMFGLFLYAVHKIAFICPNSVPALCFPYPGNKRKGLQWVIDVTIAYPKARPMDIQTWIFGYRPPTVTHVHYR